MPFFSSFSSLLFSPIIRREWPGLTGTRLDGAELVPALYLLPCFFGFVSGRMKVREEVGAVRVGGNGMQDGSLIEWVMRQRG